MSNTPKIDFCFVISDLLSTTPRAYRTIKTLLEKNYSVALICNIRRFHALKYHQQLIQSLEKYSFTVYEIEWKRFSFRTISQKIIHRLFYAIHKKVRLSNRFFLSLANDYAILSQKNKIKNIPAKIYVGHRPATLPVLWYAKQKFHAQTWFDIEDEHFEESTNLQINQKMTEFISQFPADNYTNASQLIGKSFCKKITDNPSSIEILNSPLFEKDFFTTIKSGTYHYAPCFFWFSQTVTFGRGLELFLKALETTKLTCRVDIAGILTPDFQKFIKKLTIPKVELNFHGFITENEINRLAYQSDIGLAIEQPNVDLSRNLSITNKILTYALTGTYILATKTKGQEDFMKRIPQNGQLINATTEAMIQFLLKTDIEKIRKEKQNRIENAQKLSWKHQAEKMLHFIEKFTLHDVFFEK